MTKILASSSTSAIANDTGRLLHPGTASSFSTSSAEIELLTRLAGAALADDIVPADIADALGIAVLQAARRPGQGDETADRHRYARAR